jgi:acetyl esterase/lipase
MSKQTYTFKVVGDCKLQADVYGATDGPARPVVLWFHGGGLITGTRDISSDQQDIFLSAGFVVVTPDYRLAPETKLPSILQDVVDACAWVRKQGPQLYNIDPERLVVGGASAGGYLALMTGFCLDFRPRALISFFGYGDIAGAWYSQPAPYYCQLPMVSEEEAYSKTFDHEIATTPPGVNRGRFYRYCRQKGIWLNQVVGHDPVVEPEAFDPYCPIRHVTADYPPTFLMHGDKDTDVPYEQSVMMAAELARKGVRCEFVTVKDGAHGFDLKEPIVAKGCQQMVTFVKRQLW